MEKLDYKYKTAQAALKSLHTLIVLIEQDKKTSLHTLTTSTNLSEHQLVYREALIQRFEYSVDIFGKYLKEFLLIKFGRTQQPPKSIIREAFAAELIDEENTELFMEMIDDRNITSHTYMEPLAIKIARHIPAYCIAMQLVLTNNPPPPPALKPRRTTQQIKKLRK